MSIPPRGFSIRFFLPDGTSDGMKIVEKSNWIGRAIVCPRSKFADLRERPEFNKTGVYLLIGQNNPDEPPTAYIGEGDPVGDRLLQHQRLKDFWSSVVSFTSKDDNLNKAHVQYLESRLVALAREAKRCNLENATVPTLPSLSEADRAEMEEFLEHTLQIYPALGVSVFQKPSPIAPAHVHMFQLSGKNFIAQGYEADDGFVVMHGSMAAKDSSVANESNIFATRKHLIEHGLLVDDVDHYRLTQDYTFTSPSLAAAVMLGRAANGRIEWKDPDGRTLKEIQIASAAGADSK
jgi:hypothetical protein